MSRAVNRVVATTLGVLASTVLTAVPAFAADPVGPLEGNDPGSGLGPGATLLLYVVTPVAALVAIAAAVLLPGALKAHRYRPAEGWSAAPVWFAGPVDADAAVAGASTGDVVRGGASGNW